MLKGLLPYIAILVFFGAGILLVTTLGARLHPNRAASEKVDKPAPAAPNARPQEKVDDSASSGAFGVLRENLRHPVSVLLLQVIAILLATRAVGALLRKVGQPAVIGEMVAGILLGPSLLGLLSPAAMNFLFPPTSMNSLRLLSQAGVVIFMFIVGMDLKLQHIRQRAHAAVMVSHTSTLAPLFLGAALALLIYRSSAPSNITFAAFASFMSVAMSVTAFPVLARIIEERGLSGSHLGGVAITCAAVDDVTAWCLLAVVVAIVKASGLGGAVLTIFLALLFIGLMLLVVRKQADRIINKRLEGGARRRGLAPLVLVFVFASALFTEIIGIHALFGAFLAGVVMPSGAGLRKFLKRRLEILTSYLLLPLFFAFTGLRTQINLLDDWSSWFLCAGVIVVAIAGKLGGSALAARWTGMGWQDSFSLGALMNSRGLVELIVLNLGYDLGILSPRIFSIMVVMALVTTFMTGPLLSLVEFWKRREAPLGIHIGRMIDDRHQTRQNTI